MKTRTQTLLRSGLTALISGAVFFCILHWFSGLDFVLIQDSMTAPGDILIWNLVLSVAMAVAFFGLAQAIQNYVSSVENKAARKEFIRKTTLRYFLPLILACIAVIAICALFDINTIGEMIIFATIYICLTFPKFVQKHLPKE